MAIQIIPSQHDQRGVNIVMTGDLRLQHIEQQATEVLSAFERYDAIAVQVSDTDDMDLSCLQLLYSIHSSAKKHNKTIRIDIKLSQEVTTLFKHAGLDTIIKQIQA